MKKNNKNIGILSQEDKINLLKDITNLLTDYCDINFLKKKTVELVGKAYKCNRCFIWLFDQEFNKFGLIDEYSEFISSPEDARSLVNYRFSDAFHNLIIPQYRENKCFIIPDIDEFLKQVNDPDITKALKDYFQVKSNFCCPILKNESLIGVFVLHYTKTKVQLADDEIELMRILSKHVLYTIENFKIRYNEEKSRNKEKKLREITQKIRSTLNAEEVKRNIVESIGKIYNADRCFIVEHDWKSEKSYVTEEYLASKKIKSTKNIFEQYDNLPYFRRLEHAKEEFEFTNTEEFIQTHDLSETPVERFFQDFNVKYMIAFPIFDENIPRGRIVLHYSEDKRKEIDIDAEFLRILADQASIAIRQARMFEEQKKLAERESLFREIITTVRESLDINVVKKKIVTEIGKAFSIDRCVLHQFNPETEKFQIIDEFSEYTSEPEIVSFRGLDFTNNPVFDYFDKLFRNKEGFYASDWNEWVETHEQLFSEYTKDCLLAYDNKSNYALPVVFNDKLLGMLYLGYIKEKRILSSDELSFLNILVEQVGIALYQSFLYLQQKQRAENEYFKNEIASIIKNSKNIDESLLLINNKIRTYFNAENVNIVRMEKTKHELIPLKTYYEEEKPDLEITLKTTQFYELAEKCENGKIIADISEEVKNRKLKQQLLDLNLHNIAFAPFIVGHDCYFIILTNFEHLTPNRFNLLEEISNYIGSLIKDSKLFSQSQLVSAVAHELKTPVTLIKGYSEALLNRQIEESKIDKSLKTIVFYADRVDYIINNLLLISSIELKSNTILEFRKTNLKSLIENCILNYKSKAESKNIQIILSIDNMEANANSTLLQLAISNLIDNAIKYSPNNTIINVTSYESAENICIGVKDQGYGISENNIPKIFEKFFRVMDPNTGNEEGVGIGLALVKLIAELHNGKIDVQSEINKGSIFTLCISKNL